MPIRTIKLFYFCPLKKSCIEIFNDNQRFFVVLFLILNATCYDDIFVEILFFLENFCTISTIDLQSTKKIHAIFKITFWKIHLFEKGLFEKKIFSKKKNQILGLIFVFLLIFFFIAIF